MPNCSVVEKNRFAAENTIAFPAGFRYIMPYSKRNLEMENLILRPEKPSQYREMEEIIRDAFWDKYGPGCSEHLVVHKMRTSAEVVPELCLAAEENGILTGGIWYAKAAVRSGKNVCPVLTMGPVCVKPERQSEGIGSTLIRKTLSLAAGKSPAVLIYGNPGYYARFGFRPAADFGITDADGNFCPALLIYPMTANLPEGAFDEGSIYHATPEEVRFFDQKFPFRRKHLHSGQLFFAPPTPPPPPDEPLLRASWELHQQASKVLRDSKMLEAWESIGGKIRSVGSFHSNLMMKNRDIDLHIYTADLDVARTLEALSPVIASGRTTGLNYLNGADTEEHCLDWHLRLKDDFGKEWKIDMIQILAGTRYDGVMEDVAEAVMDAATPEMRKRILALKNACPDDLTICGIEYYKAVIEDQVTSWRQFLEWRRNNPPGTLMNWKPRAER